MTDEQILALKPGDVFEEVINGRWATYKVAEVQYSGRCVNERSKAFGHAYCGVSCFWRDEKDPTRISFSVQSDDYIRGDGYPTHDGDGTRIRGCVLRID